MRFEVLTAVPIERRAANPLSVMPHKTEILRRHFEEEA